jgi:hypothetical protein
MPSPLDFVASLVGLALLSVLCLATLSVFTGVDRKRLERFALRQALVITVDNGASVICYLATTRRWRGGLLTVGLAAAAVYDIVSGRAVGVTTVVAFAGWFVGALVAEWRVDAGARGPHVAASLHRRRLAYYLDGPVLQLLVGLWLCVLGLALAGLVLALVSDRAPFGSTVGVLIAVVLVGGVIWLVTKRVLTRAQPLTADDVLAADNAIRGRSLNVLAGCGIAIGGYLGALAVDVWRLDDNAAPLLLVHLFGYGVLPILGVIVAISPRRTPIAARPRSRVA